MNRGPVETAPELPPEQMPGYHTHDGFFLRLGLGAGYARTSIATEGAKLTYSGNNIPVNAAVGTTVRPNLILFGEVMLDQILSPSGKFGDESWSTNTFNLDLLGVGPGMAYYFMPANIYISGSILFHKVSIRWSDDGDDDTTDLSTYGFGTNLMVGKEWWLSRDWGVGLAAHFMVASDKNRALYENSGILVEGRWNSIAFGLLMSATYN